MQDLLNSNEYRFVVDYFKKMDFSDRDIYANWLAQTYYFVCHSTRLSSLGASRLPVDSSIGKRMAAHTIEEKGHHALALKDIEAIGKDIRNLPAFGVTNAFYQAQYYKVLFEDPHHLLGQIFMLEAFSVDVGRWMYEIVKKSHGETASRFVKVHAYEDEDHVEKALEAINGFSPQHQEGVRTNFHQACEMYFYILKSVNERSFAALCKKSVRVA